MLFYRTSLPLIFADELAIHADGKVVAGIGDNNFTSFYLEPGNYLFSSRVNFFSDRFKLKVKAGKTYYARQQLYPVGIGLGISMFPITKAEMEEIMEDDEMVYVTMKPAHKFKDLSADDLKTQQEKYAEWVTENPDKAKKHREYNGYE